MHASLLNLTRGRVCWHDLFFQLDANQIIHLVVHIVTENAKISSQNDRRCIWIVIESENVESVYKSDGIKVLFKLNL